MVFTFIRFWEAMPIHVDYQESGAVEINFKPLLNVTEISLGWVELVITSVQRYRSHKSIASKKTHSSWMVTT
jgi:hypothetical protein